MWKTEFSLAALAWAVIAGAVTLPIRRYPLQLLAAFAIFFGGVVVFAVWLHLTQPRGVLDLFRIADLLSGHVGC